MAKSPLEIVNARMLAHNQHDLEGFLACYAENIQVYDYPAIKLGAQGKEHITKIFAPLFASHAVKTTVHSQMVNGNVVVNRETVVREGKSTEYISIYEVNEGLIESVRCIK
ncbi:MAG: nuclear transport factor 2 family protein [Planctomycetota bacterium]